ATVQREQVSDEQLSTLFWINALLGVVLALASLAMAPLLVAFYREPRLLWVTAFMGVGFFLNALGVQHTALLQRHLRFTTIAVIEAASLIASTVTGIVMALAGLGYWSLVAMALVVPAVNSAGAWLAAGWIPGRPRRGVGVLSMIRFGGAVTLNALVMYFAYNLDKVLLGRFRGAEVLGVYGRAYQLVNIPTENLNAAVGGVAFSALSRLQDDKERFRNYFLKGYALVLGVTWPVTIACALFARDIVLVALGAKWLEVAQLLRLLAPTIMVFALINPLSWLMFSYNLVGRSLKIAFVIAPVVTIGYALGLPFGAAGIAFAFSASMLLLAVPVSLWAVHGTVVSWRDLLEVSGRPFVAALVGAVFCLLITPLLARVPWAVMRLVLGTGVLVVLYGWTLLYALGQKAFYLDLVKRVLGRSMAEGEPAEIASVS
ncbi:MAG TPA: lipopolysaccharide biosynthesis protein, partial [Acidimicrobiales bacterium]|nr:lipopolysaccharide biosynthesis protein [Acidimicrobiales bacterium]